MYPLCLPLTYMIRPLHPLNIRSFRYASALKLSPITPSELSSSTIRFRYSSVQHPCYILPLSVPFFFRKFSTDLSVFRAGENGLRQHSKLWSSVVSFCIRFVFVGQWDQFFTWYIQHRLFSVIRACCGH